eukprot:TRINITY_DN3520_c0_g1_i1.p1 TRINITY_DN3520_c0_g1~~TRINITY_DN3520_c0_g1_i1.p1  ORF type:complete len:117 (+),score=8.82 TRINITY_DN3520_c0_g1_i1:172-522(+)
MCIRDSNNSISMNLTHQMVERSTGSYVISIPYLFYIFSMFNTSSSDEIKVIALPGVPNLPTLPVLCMKASYFLGRSQLITKSQSQKSIPLASKSVVTMNLQLLFSSKFLRIPCTLR